MEAASRKLPPLVSKLAVYPNVAMTGKPVEIAFTALENRTKHVKYEVYVTPEGGERQVILAGDVSLKDPVVVFNTNNGDNPAPLPTPEESLFNRRVNLKWDATLNGKPLAEGSYAVEVQLMDDDGNLVPASVNTDEVSENNTERTLSVVNGEPVSPASFSFN